jgi:hypothetical protein
MQVLGLVFVLLSLAPFWAVLVVEAGWTSETCEGFCPRAPTWMARHPFAVAVAVALAWMASAVALLVMLARRAETAR